MLMAQYNKLVAHLEEKEYHGDAELEALVDRLGMECQEAEEEIGSNEERIREITFFRKYGGPM